MISIICNGQVTHLSTCLPLEASSLGSLLPFPFYPQYLHYVASDGLSRVLLQDVSSATFFSFYYGLSILPFTPPLSVPTFQVPFGAVRGTKDRAPLSILFFVTKARIT